MKIFVCEYEAPAGQDFFEVSTIGFENMLDKFDREQVSFEPLTRLDYALKNQNLSPSAQIMSMFDDYDVISGIHQDSDRDIFLCVSK